MSERKDPSRRDLLARGSAAGGGLVLASQLVRPGVLALAAEPPQVPRRVLGRTGAKVPILLMGGSMNFDPNLHHENGFTPLAYAAMKGSVPMLDLLLRNGADPAQLTKEGDTPVELALRMGHAEAADLLKRARMSAAAEAPAAAQPAAQAAV